MNYNMNGTANSLWQAPTSKSNKIKIKIKIGKRTNGQNAIYLLICCICCIFFVQCSIDVQRCEMTSFLSNGNRTMDLRTRLPTQCQLNEIRTSEICNCESFDIHQVTHWRFCLSHCDAIILSIYIDSLRMDWSWHFNRHHRRDWD